MTETRPVKPWQKIPSEWVCVTCKDAPVGFQEAPGIRVFFCEEHRDELADMVYRINEWSHGYDRIRTPWRYWAESFYWRPRNWINRTFTKEGRERRRGEIRLRDLFHDVPA